VYIVIAVIIIIITTGIIIIIIIIIRVNFVSNLDQHHYHGSQDCGQILYTVLEIKSKLLLVLISRPG